MPESELGRYASFFPYLETPIRIMKLSSIIPFSTLGSALLAIHCPAVPIITKQPSPLTNSVSVGAFLTNRISATTTNPPLTYQWKLNGVTIADATNTLLILTNIQPADAGNYVMIVSDGDSSVSSSAWVVDVDPTFTKITSRSQCRPVGRATGVAWGDYNNDGYSGFVRQHRERAECALHK